MSINIVYKENYIKNIIIKAKDNVSILNLSNQNNIPISNIISENNNIRKGEYIVVSNSNYKTYIVKPLDTLQSIANKFNKDIEYLVKINNTNKVFIGQQLFI